MKKSHGVTAEPRIPRFIQTIIDNRRSRITSEEASRFEGRPPDELFMNASTDRKRGSPDGPYQVSQVAGWWKSSSCDGEVGGVFLGERGDEGGSQLPETEVAM